MFTILIVFHSLYIHTYIHTHIHTYIHTHIHTYIHTYTHTHTYIHTHTHTYIHTYIHTHIHTYIHTYDTYPHTYIILTNFHSVHNFKHNAQLYIISSTTLYFFNGILTNKQHIHISNLTHRNAFELQSSILLLCFPIYLITCLHYQTAAAAERSINQVAAIPGQHR